MGADDDGCLVAESVDEPAVFAGVFDSHYAAIWRYLCRRAGPTLADDLSGEVFLRAFAARAAYRPSGLGARPWLYGIATNVLRENARREERHLRALSRAGSRERATADMDDVNARVDAAVLARVVAQAIATLSPGDRDALLLLALTELDYDGIAAAMSVPIGTVRSRLNRARHRVRAELGLELNLEKS